MIDGSSGDQLTLTHLATQTDSVHMFCIAAETFFPDSFDVANGGTATLAGAFTPADDHHLQLSMNRPRLQPTDRSLAGLTTYELSTLAISTLPEAETRGFFTSEPVYLIFAPGYKTDSTAVSATWASGEPSEYVDPVACCRYYTYRFIQLPGTTNTAIFGRLLASRTVHRLRSGTARAGLGMVVSRR